MPYPTATIYVPWDELTDTDGVIDPAHLPANVALTDAAPETFDAGLAVVGNLAADTLDVAGDVYCGEDVGVVGDLVVGDTLVVGTTLSERGRGVPLGEWQAVTFNAAHFTSSAGTWTVAIGQVNLNRYTLVGKTLTWAMRIDAATLAGAGVYLYITPPVGMAMFCPAAVAYATDGTGAPTVALVVGIAGGGQLVIQQVSGAAWPGGAAHYLYFTAVGELA